MVEYILIFYGIIIGGFFALMAFGAGKLGQQGEGTFNWVKAGLCMIVGAAFGGWVAYGGATVSPDVLALLFSTFTLGGFGVIALIDMVAQMVASFLQPKSSLTQGMAMQFPRV